MLKKELGALDVFCIAAGAMISSGLFVLPGIAFAKAGPSMILAYAFAGILMIPSLLAKAELVSAMPKAGGSYFFVERSLGPLAGTIAGFSMWLAISLKSAFAMVGIGALAQAFVPGSSELTMKLIAAASCLLFVALNIISVKGTGRLQIAFVAALITILCLYTFKGFTVTDGTRFVPFFTGDFSQVFAVTGMVFVSYGGLTKVVDISEEVKNSNRNIPLGMFSAFIFVNLLYIGVAFVTVGVVDPQNLSGSLTPIVLGGQAIAGKIGGIVIALAAIMAFATTGNAGVLAASRTPMAMSKDGLLPAIISRTSKRLKTPYISILITGGFMLIIILTISVEALVKTASTIMLMMFILMNASVIIMRHSGMQTYRPKFKAWCNPWLQIAAIIIYSFLIVEMGLVPIAIAGAFALAAILWYLFYIQTRIDRESAIVYLVKRIVSRHIGRSGLEEELKQIALERDEIMPDRFDKLINDCEILDIKESMPAKEFFHLASEKLAKRVDVSAEELYKLFIDREKESTTIVKPGLAIPHIVVEGKGKFEILLVRCKEGVIVSELYEPIRTAFVLIGSADERNYHLRALMTIAHVVSEEDFDQRWSKAANKEQLRDIVLLSGRKRD